MAGDAAGHDHHLDRKQPGDHRTDRQVAGEPLTQRGEVHVEHHHDEQEQHGDGADVDDHQQHGEELGPEQHEQSGGREEGEDQEQHRVHGIPRGNHRQTRTERGRSEQVEGDGLQHHGLVVRSPRVGFGGVLGDQGG